MNSITGIDDELLLQWRPRQRPDSSQVRQTLREMASAEGNPITSDRWIPYRITLADLSPIPSAFTAIQTSIESTQWTRPTAPAQRAVQVTILPTTQTYVYGSRLFFDPCVVREARFGRATTNVGAVIKGRNFSLSKEVEPGQYQAIALPEPMLRNISGFLREHTDQEYCCYDFVNAAYGKPQGIGFTHLEWDLRPMDPTQLHPGTAIAMIEHHNFGSSEGHVSHVALYLGPDKYLSKFGDSHIFVCTLEEMRKIYKRTPEVKIMIPIKLPRHTPSYFGEE